jgi:two-component system sensor histidine kinase UhpB
VRRGIKDADDDALRRFHHLLENAQDMIYRMRLVPTRAVEYVSGAAEAITGHAAEDFYEDPDLPRKAVHPEDAHHITEGLNDPANLEPSVILRWIHPDGRVVWAEHRRVPVHDASGRLIAIEGIARDVTERVDIQRRLRESEEQLRHLAARLQTALEEERAHLARELHDELGQTLTAIKLEVSRTMAAMTKDRVALQTIDRLQSLAGLIDIGISTVKRIATNLRPPTLDHLGLAAAIRWEAMAFRARTGLRCYIRADRETTGLSLQQQTVVFRIFQEALTNVVRHASASAVHVTLAERNGIFELRIRDNGRGIRREQAGDARSRIPRSPIARAALIGGTFEITGRPAKGTVVTVQVPSAATAAHERVSSRGPSVRRRAR